MKNTAKPVTEVPFPSVTICGSGFHMSNVEKQVVEDFSAWREENGKIDEDTDKIKADLIEYMKVMFQIEQPSNSDDPVTVTTSWVTKRISSY